MANDKKQPPSAPAEAAPETPAPETPRTFVACFLATARTLVADALKARIDEITPKLHERTGFPRGATYTDWTRRNGEAANASLTIEARTDGAGFDVILSPMHGSNAVDAAHTFAWWIAAALYPAVKVDGSTKMDRQTKARTALVTKTLGITKSKAGVSYSRPEWDALAAFWPAPIYRGSDKPNPKRMMVAFREASDSKRIRYYSLRLDGSEGDAAFIAGLYAAGQISGPVKTSGPHTQHYSAPVKPQEKTGTEG